MKRCIETEEATPSELASNYDETYSEIDNGYLMNREDLSQMSSKTEQSLHRIAKFNTVKIGGFADKAKQSLCNDEDSPVQGVD